MIEKFRISIIAALSKNNVIGINNKLPWNIKEDLKYFKEITLYKSIIMGRKTFESIGRALPDRDNIVITSNKEFSAKKIQTASCLESALYKAKCNDIFIIGGAQIYKEAIGFADFLYLTRVDKDYDGDAYFPIINFNEWKLLREAQQYSKTEKVNFNFQVFKRNLQ